jgi:hypothetical protein
MIQLWPSHFDIALELGDEAGGGRANYGFSPCDDEHPAAGAGLWASDVPYRSLRRSECAAERGSGVGVSHQSHGVAGTFATPSHES